ncbi:MAG: extracellular solute-binding protein [Proteobacteria bacterium]|nr:extracellular solute-binding protein [Pseudomonadota bacterium]MCH8097890.1 extracellular solute-binding protein [Pseudomonadota bacterium]
MSRLGRTINKNRPTVLTGVLVATAIAFGGGPALALTEAEIVNLKGPERQKILVAGARKEGTVVWYSAMIIDQALRPVSNAFQKKYPFIKVTYWRGNSRKILQKVLAEKRANALVADIVEGSGLAKGMLKANAVQPFSSPELAAYPKEYIHPKRLWVTSRFRYLSVAYNTKLVSKSEAPKSYEDLLNPKWKGRMAWRTGASSSGALLMITNWRTAWGDKKTEAFLKKLAKQDVTPVQASNRTVVNRVIEGEYWIAIGASAHHPIISAKKGAPVYSQIMPPVPGLNGTIMVLNGIKHPYAAMLLVDFVLSEEGQNVLRQANYLPAHPKVAPRPEMKIIVPRLVGMEENFITPAILFENRKQTRAMFNKYFK